jgi:epoxyqueuosine reductase QueG
MMTFDPAETLRELYDADEGKFLDGADRTCLFDPPLAAVADANDPWFARFKEVIGPFHWTPREALDQVHPQHQARAVICWCLPIAEPVRKANRGETRFPARAWALTRTKGNDVLSRMAQGLVDSLGRLGFVAVSPDDLPDHKAESRPGTGWTSNWSLRHEAFVAGLGTFGISGGLITQAGIAHRLGSVVTDAPLAATRRPYGDDAFAWCLRSSRGTCGACIARCPAGSIRQTAADRNKVACFEHGRLIRRQGAQLYGWEGRYGCGLCQTGVPCEDRNPTAIDR